ncbi:MAG: hypothetical protein U0528_10360 [Anaerolineae bacterium]
MISYLQNENGLAARFIYAQSWLQQWLQTSFGVQIQGVDPASITAARNQRSRSISGATRLA